MLLLHLDVLNMQIVKTIIQYRIQYHQDPILNLAREFVYLC